MTLICPHTFHIRLVTLENLDEVGVNTYASNCRASATPEWHSLTSALPDEMAECDSLKSAESIAVSAAEWARM